VWWCGVSGGSLPVCKVGYCRGCWFGCGVVKYSCVMDFFIGIHAWGLSADFHCATPEYLVSYCFGVAGGVQFPLLWSDVTTPFMSRMQALDAELLARRQTELLEKEGSGCRVLLANDRYEDLSRLYRLFSRIPDGLVRVAEIFKAHITDLGESAVNGCDCCVCCGRNVVTVAHTACAVLCSPCVLVRFDGVVRVIGFVGSWRCNVLLAAALRYVTHIPPLLLSICLLYSTLL
jgi:hypothetical protein